MNYLKVKQILDSTVLNETSEEGSSEVITYLALKIKTLDTEAYLVKNSPGEGLQFPKVKSLQEDNPFSSILKLIGDEISITKNNSKTISLESLELVLSGLIWDLINDAGISHFRGVCFKNESGFNFIQEAFLKVDCNLQELHACDSRLKNLYLIPSILVNEDSLSSDSKKVYEFIKFKNKYVPNRSSLTEST